MSSATLVTGGVTSTLGSYRDATAQPASQLGHQPGSQQPDLPLRSLPGSAFREGHPQQQVGAVLAGRDLEPGDRRPALKDASAAATAGPAEPSSPRNRFWVLPVTITVKL